MCFTCAIYTDLSFLIPNEILRVWLNYFKREYSNRLQKWFANCKLLICWQIPLNYGADTNLYLRLNTGMAPTCDWMIKIVKLISYIVTPCSWVLWTACLEAEQWNINVITLMSQIRNGYLNNEEKAEFILFSEVVQRYSGDEKVIRWQALLTELI